VESSPAVANGVVYVGSDDHNLYAFDATGNTNCSGSPKTCSPLWTAPTGGSVVSSPAVANGVVYVGSADNKLYAFDAAGNTNCSGSPTTCQPLWTATTVGPVFSSPAVANGVVYVGSNDTRLYAFDAAGVTNCSGSPTTCEPLFFAFTGAPVGVSSPAVANGVVYIGSEYHKLWAFGLEKIPPATSVVQPSNGATLSGTTTLVASASDDVTVSKVEFHLTGASYNDALIGVATPTRFGWIYNWNTASVPNDTYTLNSVATDLAGNVGRSANVTITVSN
jgi:outer membrane protein assembly factor BamB